MYLIRSICTQAMDQDFLLRPHHSAITLSPFPSTVAFSAVVSASPLLLNPCDQKLLGTYFGSAGRDATFDYVIIGGGTTGSVVASRLAQNTDATIAVIEAGSFYEIGSKNLSQYHIILRAMTAQRQVR